MNILIIRLSSIGDVILTTSCIQSISMHYPQCSICLLTSVVCGSLFKDDERIDELLLYDKNTPLSSGDPLANRSWDVVLDLQHSARSRRLVRRACADSSPCVARFDKLHTKRALLLYGRINSYRRHEDAVIVRYHDAAAKCLPRLGAHIPRPEISFDRKAAAGCCKRILKHCSLAASKSLAIFPFSTWANKQWPLERFAEIASRFIDEKWNVLIFGGQQDRGSSNRLQERISGVVCNLTGELSLLECAFVISQCSLALGNDSGLSHLAGAVGVNTGIIYGSTTWHWGFFPADHRRYRIFESAQWCRPCHAHGGNVCFRSGRRCLDAVSVETVFAGLLELCGKPQAIERSTG
ncbi:MAG: hypothetical protein GF398_21300 [Chitinivibrionales bacterium]|nr:hypothetical protein [Chitinivibrionales bacterium]